jgi:hypothetical protein
VTRNDADAIVHLLMNEWVKNADPELQDRWKKVSPFLWTQRDDSNRFKCTLNWKEWDLSVVTFDVPQSLSGINAQTLINSQHIVLVEEELTEHAGPVIVHLQVADAKYPGRKTTLLPVAELVDSFLAGEWTPWWTCRCCHMRKQMKITPQ